MFKFIKKEFIFILVLSAAATIIWIRPVINRMNAVETFFQSDENEKVPVTIIMYHSILKSKSGKYIVSPQQLENDIKYLSDNGYNFINMEDLIDFVKIPWTTLPDKPVILTFDDGHYNNYVYAYPLMEKYNAKMVLSIVGSYTENETGKKQHANYSYVNWDQIKEMDKSGRVEIQNHSYNLHNTKGRIGAAKLKSETAEEYKEFFKEDTTQLKKLLKKNTGIKVTAYTYPFGIINDLSNEVLKDLKYSAALSCQEGINYIGKDDDELLFHLKRFNRASGKSSAAFFKGKLE